MITYEWGIPVLTPNAPTLEETGARGVVPQNKMARYMNRAEELPHGPIVIEFRAGYEPKQVAMEDGVRLVPDDTYVVRTGNHRADGQFIEVILTDGMRGGNINTEEFAEYNVLQNYGRTWRAWYGQPTQEQMAIEPWAEVSA